MISELREVYCELDVPINEKKSVKSQLCAEMQGGGVSLTAKRVSFAPSRIRLLGTLRGAWSLLQSKRTDLKKIQMVAGGLVYLFSCLMSCLNEIWALLPLLEGAWACGRSSLMVLRKKLSPALRFRP